MPVIQSNSEIQTYSDSVQYVLDSHALERAPLNERHARSAVRRAYSDLPKKHAWNYYYRQRLMQTVEDYSTGTIVYDHTGGAHERMLTLTTGTWPSWAAYGRVIIDDVHYEVDDRKSDSIITLTETSNPGADVASTTYQIYRNSYPLPANFGVMHGLWSVSEQMMIPFVDQRNQYQALQAFYETPAAPRHATIRATGKYISGVELVLGPPPDELLTYDMLYQAFPRALSIEEYANATVSITSGAATVTGATGVVFPTTCVGSIIRFSSGSVKPTGPLGGIDGAENPFVYQGVIKSRDSATQLTLEEVMPTTISSLSAVGYTISDPIDIDTNRMLTAFQLACEAEFSRLAARKDMMEKSQMAMSALRLAMESDEMVGPMKGQPSYYNRIDHATVIDSE
jgi:hypothetical protein